VPTSVSRLARQIPVDSLMTPTRRLRRASSIEDARILFAQYDIVPAPTSGRVTGYFDKSTNSRHDLMPEVLISSGTPILDLPGLLSLRPFFFVIKANAIAGYIHYSDLNRPPARAPFYAQLEAVENVISRRMAGVVADADVKAITSPSRYSQLKRHLDRRRSQNLDLGWTAVLSLGELLRLARRYHTLKLEDEDLALVTRFRNRVAHASLRLIEKHSEVRELSKVSALLDMIVRST